MRSATEIKRSARRAGMLYLAAALLAMFGYLYLHPRFVISGDAAATARNILADEQLYRTGILIDVAGQLLFIVAVLALYRLFEDVDRNQARLMRVSSPSSFRRTSRHSTSSPFLSISVSL
jgi:uncharacterized protein DUF4386